MFISARFWSTSTKLFQAVQVAYIYITSGCYGGGSGGSAGYFAKPGRV